MIFIEPLLNKVIKKIACIHQWEGVHSLHFKKNIFLACDSGSAPAAAASPE
jgi:hypothetical protein